MTVAGLVVEVRKRGPRVTLMLDDRSGRIEVMLFEEICQQHRDLIAKDAILLVEGQLRFDEFSDAWRSQRAKRSATSTRCANSRRGALVAAMACQRVAARTPSCERLAAILKPGAAAPAGHQVEYTRGRGASGALALGPRMDGARQAASCSNSSKRLSGRDADAGACTRHCREWPQRTTSGSAVQPLTVG